SFSFIQDASLWSPNPGSGQFPPLTASTEDATKFFVILSRIAAGFLEPAENILSIGSVDEDILPDTLKESDFSNTGPDVKAVGKDVNIACPGQLPGINCTAVDGTSFSSPQVAGLASYLWLLSPELRLRPPGDTA